MTTKQLILDKVEESFKTAETFFNRTFSRPVNIIFKRSGTTGGWCNFGTKELMFQLDLAEHNQDEFINQIVPHEVAHWIDKEVYGYQYNGAQRSVHGKTWKYIMVRVYKLNPDRCHSMDTSVTKTKKQTRFHYVCANGHSLKLSMTIHNRMVGASRSYKCKCGGKLSINTHLQIQSEIEQLRKQIEQLSSLT